MSDKFVGSYFPVNSIIHKINSAIKLVNLFFIILLSCLTNNPIVIVSTFVLMGIYILFSNVPIKYYFKFIISFIFIYFIIAIILFLTGLEPVIVGVNILKVIVILLNIIIIFQTTSTNELITGTMKIINVLNIFVINFNKLGIKICQIIKFIPTFYQTLHIILNSQASRGIDYRFVTIIGRWKAILSNISRVFAITFERLKNLEIEIEQKLFNLNYNRRKIYLSKLNVWDYVFLMIHILLFVYFMTRLNV